MTRGPSLFRHFLYAAADVAGGVQLLISIAGEQLALWLDHLHKEEVLDDKIFRYDPHTPFTTFRSAHFTRATHEQNQRTVPRHVLGCSDMTLQRLLPAGAEQRIIHSAVLGFAGGMRNTLSENSGMTWICSAQGGRQY